MDEKIKMLSFLREKKVLQNMILDTFSKSHFMLHFHLLHHCERVVICVPYDAVVPCKPGSVANYVS